MVRNLVSQRRTIEARRDSLTKDIQEARDSQNRIMAAKRERMAEIAAKIKAGGLSKRERNRLSSESRGLDKSFRRSAKHLSYREERFRDRLNSVQEDLTAITNAERRGTTFGEEERRIATKSYRRDVKQLKGKALERHSRQRDEAYAATLIGRARMGGRVDAELLASAKKVQSSRERRIASDVALGRTKSAVVSASGARQIKKFQKGRSTIRAVQERRVLASRATSTPMDANISLIGGTQARVEAPFPLASFGKPSKSQGPQSDLRGITRRIEGSQARTEDFFGSKGFERIRKTSRFLTGGRTDVNFESRSFAGKTAELVVFGALSAPIAIGGALVSAEEKVLATADALRFPETRERILPELGRSAKEVEATSYSFLPGGTPINPEGTATLVSAAVFALPIAAGKSAPPIRTSGPKGPISVEVRTKLQSTTEGSKVSPPIKPQAETTLRFDETVKFPQSVTRGRTAKTKIVFDVEGGLTKTTVVGKSRFVTKQPKDADRSITKEYKGRKLVDTRVTKPLPVGGQRVEFLETSKNVGPISTSQRKPSELVQYREAGRSLYVDQRTPGGRNLIGGFGEITKFVSITKAADTRITASQTGLEVIFPKGTRVVAERVGSTTDVPATLRVGTKAQLAKQERVFSRQELDIGVLEAREEGFFRLANINRLTGTKGKVFTISDFGSVTRGELFFAEKQGRIGLALESVQDKVVSLYGSRTKSSKQPKVIEENLFLDEPLFVKKKSGGRKETSSTDLVQTISKPPKSVSKTVSGEFFIEPLDIGFTRPTFPLRTLSRPSSRSIIGLPPGIDSRTSGRVDLGRELIPAQDLLPSPITKPLGKTDIVTKRRTAQDSITTPDLITTTTPRNLFPGPSQGFSFMDGGPPPPSIGFAPIALPFGGAGGGSGGFSPPRLMDFENEFSPSLAGKLYKVKGTKRQANIASITGVGIRPLIIT